MNRLKLDFTIDSIEARKEFIDRYIEEIEPTPAECETIANYILWGKEEDGKSPVQKKQINQESAWGGKKTESLEALLEMPNFTESLLHPISTVPLKAQKEAFCREDALDNSPSYLQSTFKNLFHEIDTVDFIVSSYIGQAREELLRAIPEEKQTELKAFARTLTQKNYLKLRHLLIELRKQQFTLRDSYRQSLIAKNTPLLIEADTLSFGVEIPVYPLGFVSEFPAIFTNLNALIPSAFSYPELTQISKHYWSKKPSALYFDFENPEHLYNLLTIPDLEDNLPFDSTFPELIHTLHYYIAIADLPSIYQEILQMKLERRKNSRIAVAINTKYNKSYSANYISTIFRQKIIKQIAETASYHRKIVENLFFPENFKRCNSCGRVLLKDQYNFVRKTRATDGYSNRCKVCDHKDRAKRRH